MVVSKSRWIAVLCAAAACGGSDREAATTGSADRPSEPVAVQTLEHRVAVVEGFSGPEAVRYDPDQDVWFVGNMNGGERDGDGFISRVSAETNEVEVLRFAEGTLDHPLHAPRGMFLVGDTLWVADADGVHGFHRRTGAQVAFVDLSEFAPGFLNDVALGGDAALYVTDTGRSAIFRVAGGQATLVSEDEALGAPNGITWDPSREGLVFVPWAPEHPVHLWRPGEEPSAFGPATAGRLDGVEPLDGALLVASQSDSALHVMDGEGSRAVVRTDAAPADIGFDARRRRVAVPYIALNRVDIWELPEG